MQDYKAIKEIESYGETEEDSEEEIIEEDLDQAVETVRKYSMIPLLQIACCALILLTLLYLKVFQPGMYSEITEWYQQQITEEIELPTLVEVAEPEESSSSAASQMDSIKDLDSAEGYSV